MASNNDKATLSVIDAGKGIPEADQKRIFKRFERAVSPSLVSGLGLGLFISKELIEMHAGELELKSTEGKGSNFTMTLPIEAQ